MPSVDITVMDAPLTEVNSNGVEVYICETLPTTRAEAIANALHTAAVVRAPEAITGSAATDRRYTDGTVNDYTGITLDNITGSQTPSYVAVCGNAGDGRLLQVADTVGASPLANNTQIDLTAWSYIMPAPTT